MQPKRSLIISVLLATIAVLPAFAQTDTVDQQHLRLNTAFLKPGVKQYLVYYQVPSRSNWLDLSLWVREIEKTNRNNEPVFRITQHWYGSDTARYLESLSYNSVSDFSPLFHAQTRGGEQQAYRWTANGISGDTATMNNKAADFKLGFDRPNYNWNLDIETFEMLPLKAGKTFAIRFYDAGLEPPAYVTYKVTGSEVLQTLNNQPVDCWKLFTEGDSPRGHYSQTFWISKAGHELLKEEDSFGGFYRYKVKLPGLAPYLQPRFVK
ncbi:hypothetical protein SAMN05660461_0187 [Chitinophaga ginsengisegetis]|uniref:DUF3108 domain-containing protein n=1 Tax=Chitinophaga ginsengisegetis TaxID=393003 RepID=A0A1T5N494_9BACT|nr:hypothetical protein [Chitinophaga ginsengisegetis]SKC94999.1 hypothetical protein SAMN05660461_0187 [Chitinophaga ginsengisegetis]